MAAVSSARGSFFPRLGLWLLALGCLLGFGSARDARAGCVLNGTLVICSGASPGGFTAATNGLTVDIRNGATVGTGIVLLDNNTLGNLGTVSVGSGTTAISGGNNNTFTNSGTIVAIDAGTAISITGASGSAVNSGTITVGDGGTGLSAPTATNNGTITAGDSGFGIVGTVNSGRLTNTGRITVSDDGIGISSSANSLTIVNSGTVVFGGCGTGIDAQGSGNTITNTGTLRVATCSGGSGGTGINAGDSNTVTNSGTIVVGDTGGGILGGTNTNVTNNGTITVGVEGVGIATSGNVVNNGTITVGDGVGVYGAILIDGDNYRATNNGVIVIGREAAGMAITGNDGTLTNTANGTIAIGRDSVGLYGDGNRTTILNAGTIIGARGATAMQNDGNNATLTNTGTIVVGQDGAGIVGNGNSNTLTNSGTIIIGPCGAGIDASGGSGNRVTNSGRIFGSGCEATGILTGDGTIVTNSGTISMPETGNSIYGTAGNVRVTNSGTLDGPIGLSGSGNAVTNSGLITITAPWSGTGYQHSIDGTYTQAGSGSLALRVSANPANFDSLSATGAVSLDGTLRAVVQPGLYGTRTTYSQAIGSGSLSGTFTSVQSTSIFLFASVIYGATSTDLILTRIPFGQMPNGGANGRAVAAVLESNYSTSLTGTTATFYSNLMASSAPNTLSQLTGEVSTAGTTAAFAGFSQFLGTLFSQTNSTRAPGQALNGRGGPQTAALRYTDGGGTRVALSDACEGETCGTTAFYRVTAWAQGFGAAGSMDRDVQQGTSRIDLNTAGAATGIDVMLSPAFTLGFTMGTSVASYTLTDLVSTGNSNNALFGVYGGYTMGPAYVDAGLAYGYGHFNTTRFVGTGSITERIDGGYDGSLYGGRVEAGWRFQADNATFTPFGGMTVQAFRQNGYTETSQQLGSGAPGLLALTVQPQTTVSARSLLGGQIESVFRLDDILSVTPRLRLGWAHEFNTTRSATVALSTVLPGAPFTVTGASPPSDSLIVSAGIDFDIGSMARVYARFDGDFASTAQSYAGTGGVRLFW